MPSVAVCVKLQIFPVGEMMTVKPFDPASASVILRSFFNIFYSPLKFGQYKYFASFKVLSLSLSLFFQQQKTKKEMLVGAGSPVNTSGLHQG